MNNLFKYMDEMIKENVNISRLALENNMDRFWTECAEEYKILSKEINQDELLDAFSLIINEMLLVQMHSFLVAMDGGAWVSEKYRFDIVDKESNEVLNETISLHDMFFDYLWDSRGQDPFRKYK